MPRIYSLFIALLILTFGCAQKKTHSFPENASVDCIAKWKKNDSIQLKITRETQSAERKGNESAYYYATVKVMDTLSNGYLLSWQNKPAVDFGNASLQAQMANLFLTLRIIYTTDKNGSFNSIENYDEMQQALESTIKVISDSMAHHTDTAIINQQMQQVRVMFSSREMVNQIMSRDIQLFHGAYGGTFKARPDTTRGELRIPLGQIQFPATVISALKSLDNQKKVAEISVVQQIDPIKAAKAMNDFLTEQFREAGHEPKPGEAMTKYSIADTALYSYQMSNGWISQLYSTRTMDMENGTLQTMKQTQITRIELR